MKLGNSKLFITYSLVFSENFSQSFSLINNTSIIMDMQTFTMTRRMEFAL